MSAVGQAELLNLSGKAWKPIPRVARTIPFGYAVDDAEPDLLMPVLFELEALEQAKKHLKNGFSLRVVAKWLTETTGRPISHAGLQKRVDIDRHRGRKAASLKIWAKSVEAAIEKAKSLEERIGKAPDLRGPSAED